MPATVWQHHGTALMAKGPGGGIIISLPPSEAVLAHFFVFLSLSYSSSPSKSQRAWPSWLAPSRCQRLVLAAATMLQTDGAVASTTGYHTRVALRGQHGELTVTLRAGSQLGCHRATFSTPCYSCCILSLLTRRAPNPNVCCSPFFSLRKCYEWIPFWILMQKKDFNCHLNKAKKQVTASGPAEKDWWTAGMSMLWSLYYSGFFFLITVIWGFTTADHDSFCPFWDLSCWPWKSDFTYLWGWLYLDFSPGMLTMWPSPKTTSYLHQSWCWDRLLTWWPLHPPAFAHRVLVPTLPWHEGSQDMARIHIWAKEMGRTSGSHGLDIAKVGLWEGDPILCSHLLTVIWQFLQSLHFSELYFVVYLLETV